MIAARVLALALFAARFKVYISIVCVIHWIIMFSWIISMRTSFCDNRIEELGYNSVLAVMFIFCYFNPVDSPTRYRYVIFYIFMFCENVILMSLFFFHPMSYGLWYRFPAMFGHFFLFFLGLVFMVCFDILFFSLFNSFDTCLTQHPVLISTSSVVEFSSYSYFL